MYTKQVSLQKFTCILSSNLELIENKKRRAYFQLGFVIRLLVLFFQQFSVSTEWSSTYNLHNENYFRHNHCYNYYYFQAEYFSFHLTPQRYPWLPSSIKQQGTMSSSYFCQGKRLHWVGQVTSNFTVKQKTKYIKLMCWQRAY